MAKNSFDELVINMPQAERIELYNRLIASLNASEQTLVENTVPEEYDNTGDIEKKLKTESRFFKFLLYIRSLFSGTAANRSTSIRCPHGKVRRKKISYNS